jgi:hypothetical protein
MMQIERWSELKMRLLRHVKTKKQLRCEAALYSYLIPCYLTAMSECTNANAKGAVFFCRVLVQLLNKIESMLDEDQREPDKSTKNLDATDILTQLWMMQNKVFFLQRSNYINLFCAVLPVLY